MKTLLNKLNTMIVEDLKKKNSFNDTYNYVITNIQNINNLYLVHFEGFTQEGDRSYYAGVRMYDITKDTFLRIVPIRAEYKALTLSKVIYSNKPLKFDYISHKIDGNLYTILHVIEPDGTFIFSQRSIIPDNSAALNKGKFDRGYTYKPKKVYESSKGIYVNVNGFRFYFNDFITAYQDIYKYID